MRKGLFMSIIIFIGICFLLFAFPYLRIVLFNFPKWVILSLKDFFFYFRNFSFNVCPSGKIICYSGLFGFGKTLSAVYKVVSLYKRYNDKKCFVNGHWRIQKIVILSNVALKNVPYMEFKSLEDITNWTHLKENLDNDKFYYVLLVLGDEFSTCLNSRNFKSNIDPIFLNTLVTSRHYAISLYYTSQRFNLVDKLLRDVTFYVIECRKIGRVELQKRYDAFDLENCSNVSLVKPLSRSGFLITDEVYNSYDTLAVVNNLIKSVENNDMLSEMEIINNISSSADSIDQVRLKNGARRRIFGKRR